MCSIIDANVVHEVFGPSRPNAGEKFFEWLNTENGRLAVGGKLYEELTGSSELFRRWGKEALLSGRMKVTKKSQVNRRVQELAKQGKVGSDDIHIIALAQISGARLLYSNDKTLHKDFKKKKLLDNPRGKIYSTAEKRDFSNSHKKLLGKRSLCQA